jgi:hypothetical protein
MRKKLIGFIILLIALSLLTIGIIEEQFADFTMLYDQMILVP